jgi:hypothetical protein
LRVTLAALVAAIIVLTTVGPVSARWTGNQGQLDRTVAYMQGAQNPDGGFGGSKGSPSDPLFTAWVGIGLAAAGVNPQDQAVAGGTDVYTYLTGNAGALDLTTDFERAGLVAVAAGASLRDFGGRDLAGTILARQLPDGSLPHTAGGTSGGINDTAFAILMLSAEPGTGTALADAAAWLVTVQGDDGGWSYAPGASESTDMTGAVLQALQAAPPATGTDAPARAQARRTAWSYLRGAQHADGGFGQTPTDGESNVASTAWVVQALWAVGEDPAAWAPAGHTPLDYLASMQQADGSIRYMSSQSMNDLWMTAYVAPAFAGYPLPVPAVPRAVRPPSTTAPASTAGVTSGGGGNGAPLFSRPQPGSKGRASGGVQQVTATGSAAQKTTATLRAEGAKKVATGTAQSNGAAARGVTPARSPIHRTPRRRSATPEPKPIRAPRGSGAGGGGGREVTGRLLGGTPTSGVSGTGRTVGVAPGLRTASTPDDPPTTALVLAGLLALAALGGAAGEARSGRKELFA